MSFSPDPPEFSVVRAEWDRDGPALKDVRHRVFVDEQQVPEDLEWDGEDENAVHLLARDAAGKAIGTARLLATGQIGRMAVLPEWRRRGVGSALLREILAIAGESGRPRPFLNAQVSALGFYARLGFRAVGAELEEAGIPHRRMVPDEAAGPDAAGIPEQPNADERGGAITLADRATVRAQTLTLASLARRELRILSRELDPFVYDDAQVLAALRDLVLRVRRLAVRILVFDPGPAVRHGHRLIELARRHTSHMEIRRVPAEHHHHTEAFLLADDRGYLLQPLADVWEGTANRADPLTVRRLGADFERLWEVSEQDAELRRLFL